jgi:hypothetical protein
VYARSVPRARAIAARFNSAGAGTGPRVQSAMVVWQNTAPPCQGVRRRARAGHSCGRRPNRERFRGAAWQDWPKEARRHARGGSSGIERDGQKLAENWMR